MLCAMRARTFLLGPVSGSARGTTRGTTQGSTSGPGSRSVRPAVALVALLLSLALAGCAAGQTGPATRPQSQPVSGGTKLAALWPLTGEQVSGRTPDRPVVVTKIDNTANSRPQVGLGKADLITEELVEGGMTRLAVFFYQHLPTVAGPVRSMRASDIGIVKPAHAVVVASGAAPPTIARLKAAEVPFYEGVGPGYYRDRSRRMPYNLMVLLSKLAASTKVDPVVPASYLPWGAESDYHGTQRARSITARFSPSHTTSWAYRGGRYVNVNSFAAPGDRFDPESVLVLRVREGDAGYLDPAGHKVPETIYRGTGEMQLFHRGTVVRGTWTKTTPQAPVTLRTKGGRLEVPAGHVWIELLPSDKDGGHLTSSR